MTSVDQRELDLPGVPERPDRIGAWAAERDARDVWLMAAEAASDRQERAAEWDEWLAGGAS